MVSGSDSSDEYVLEESEKPYNIGHRCYYFSKEIILFIKGCKYEKIYFSLFDQLMRSATSIGANVIEAKAGSSMKDWKKFLIIGLKSANETKYWLCLIKETLGVDRNKIDELIKEANELLKIIASIVIKAGK